MHLNIFVSQECFFYCKGCYSYSREEKIGQKVPTNNLIEFLNYIYNNNGINKVTFCGGDPLTRSDIIDLLKKTKEIGFKISLDTIGCTIIDDFKRNGKVIYKKTDVKKLSKYVDNIGIPLDGSNSNIINIFRNANKEILEQQINICKELHKNNANICVNTVVHKGNLDDAKKLADLINKLDFIKHWQLFKFLPSGKFGNLFKELYDITDQQYKLFQEEIYENILNKDIKVEFKDANVRDKLYMLIDNSGNAWVQGFKNKNEIRNIIGNINKKEEWENISKILRGDDNND